MEENRLTKWNQWPDRVCRPARGRHFNQMKFHLSKWVGSMALASIVYLSWLFVFLLPLLALSLGGQLYSKTDKDNSIDHYKPLSRPEKD